MAQYWYEFGDLTPTKKPYGFLGREIIFPGLKMEVVNIRGQSYVEINSEDMEVQDGANLPIFIVDRDFEEFELLVLSLQRSYHNNNTTFNGGRGIGVRCASDISHSALPASGLLLSVSSSDNSANQRTTRLYALPNTSSNVGTATPLPTTPNTMDIRLRPMYTRVKVTASTILSRSWYADRPEPVSEWFLNHANTFFGRKIYLGCPSTGDKSVLVDYAFISIATGSDEPLLTPLTRTRTGKVSTNYVGKTVKLCSPNSKRIYDTATVQDDGSWSLTEIICETVPKFDVYLEGADGDIYLPENVSGNGYFSSSFPDYIVTEDGRPIAGEIRVLLRDDQDSQANGVLIAKTISDGSGQWRVDNLNPILRYDVVCRVGGYNDIIFTNVSPKV